MRINTHLFHEYVFWFFLGIIILSLFAFLHYKYSENLGKAQTIVLPDFKKTPGKLIDNLNIDQTICNPSWRTETIRPPSSYTTQLKLYQIKKSLTFQTINDLGGATRTIAYFHSLQYDYQDKNPASYEEDHLCSLTNGGDPTSLLNLWPQPYLPTPGAREKDKLELQIHKLICSKKITPQEACKKIATNWLSWYNELNLKSKLGSTETIDEDDN